MTSLNVSLVGNLPMQPPYAATALLIVHWPNSSYTIKASSMQCLYCILPEEYSRQPRLVPSSAFCHLQSDEKPEGETGNEARTNQTVFFPPQSGGTCEKVRVMQEIVATETSDDIFQVTGVQNLTLG